MQKLYKILDLFMLIRKSMEKHWWTIKMPDKFTKKELERIVLTMLMSWIILEQLIKI